MTHHDFTQDSGFEITISGNLTTKSQIVFESALLLEYTNFTKNLA